MGTKFFFDGSTFLFTKKRFLHFLVLGPDHANLGERFSEIFSSAYLPNNLTEVEVCNLLRRTFHERLIFTLRRSPTIGEDNKIVLNGIELKTSLTGGPAK